MDDLHAKLVQALFKMTHWPLIVELLFNGRLGPGFIRRVLVQIRALRDAVTLYIPLHAVHGRHSALIVITTTIHSGCGIIDVFHEHTDRPPALEPAMMGAVYLDQLAQMGLPATAPPAV